MEEGSTVECRAVGGGDADRDNGKGKEGGGKEKKVWREGQKWRRAGDEWSTGVLRGDRRWDFPEKKGGCGCVCRDASWVLCSYITTSCELKKIKKIFCAPFNMGVHCTHHTSAVTHNHPP